MSKKDLIHLILFVVTIITTTTAGALMSGAEPEISFSFFISGFPFSFSLIAILGIHEMGHYLASKRHGVRATLPFFIPFPTIIGTMGAVIRIKSAIPNRKSLFDIGFSGPAAGFVVAFPILIVGLFLSEAVPENQMADMGGIGLGNSIIVWAMIKVFFRNIPSGMELLLHPVAFAAWIGLWITSINLLPIGQLDGGHISYAIFGDKSKRISQIVWVVLLPLAFLWVGWIVWALVLLFLVKLRHPPTIDPYTPLDNKRRKLAIAALGILILTFTPQPFIIY